MVDVDAEDAVLVAAMAAGDRNALSALYERARSRPIRPSPPSSPPTPMPQP